MPNASTGKTENPFQGYKGKTCLRDTSNNTGPGSSRPHAQMWENLYLVQRKHINWGETLPSQCALVLITFHPIGRWEGGQF